MFEVYCRPTDHTSSCNNNDKINKTIIIDCIYFAIYKNTCQTLISQVQILVLGGFEEVLRFQSRMGRDFG